jgi:hypothetical protein
MGTLFSLSKPWTEAWLAISEFGLLEFGILLVAGLVGEYFADHKKREYPKFKKRKRLFELLVIIGVAGELFADGGIFLFGGHLQTIAELEVARLNKEASFARLETTKLKLQISNLDIRKWPVHSITAEVKLRFQYQPDNTPGQLKKDWVEWAEHSKVLVGDMNFPARLTISHSEPQVGTKVILVSSSAIDLSLPPPASPMYLLTFSSPFRFSHISVPIPLFSVMSC